MLRSLIQTVNSEKGVVIFQPAFTCVQVEATTQTKILPNTCTEYLAQREITTSFLISTRNPSRNLSNFQENSNFPGRRAGQQASVLYHIPWAVCLSHHESGSGATCSSPREPFSPKSQGNQKCTLQKHKAVRNCCLLSGQSQKYPRRGRLAEWSFGLWGKLYWWRWSHDLNVWWQHGVKPHIWATLHFGSMCDDLLMLLPAQEVCASSRSAKTIHPFAERYYVTWALCVPPSPNVSIIYSETGST